MKKIFYLTAILFTFSSCEHHYIDWIDFKNNSENDIYYHTGWFQGGVYPDTTLSFDSTKLYKIKAKGGFSEENPGKQDVIEKISHLPQGILSVYFFSKDTLDKYSWEEVQTGYKILRRYDLSIQDMQKLNQTIPYPPTEVMKNMKMWPPYGNEK